MYSRLAVTFSALIRVDGPYQDTFGSRVRDITGDTENVHLVLSSWLKNECNIWRLATSVISSNRISLRRQRRRRQQRGHKRGMDKGTREGAE